MSTQHFHYLARGGIYDVQIQMAWRGYIACGAVTIAIWHPASPTPTTVGEFSLLLRVESAEATLPGRRAWRPMGRRPLSLVRAGKVIGKERAAWGE